MTTRRGSYGQGEPGTTTSSGGSGPPFQSAATYPPRVAPWPSLREAAATAARSTWARRRPGEEVPAEDLAACMDSVLQVVAERRSGPRTMMVVAGHEQAWVAPAEYLRAHSRAERLHSVLVVVAEVLRDHDGWPMRGPGMTRARALLEQALRHDYEQEARP